MTAFDALLARCCYASILSWMIFTRHNAFALNAFPSDKNRAFFAESFETTYCDIPPYQEGDWSISEDACLQTLSVDLQGPEIQNLAEMYAPYLFFHPLEKYTPASVNTTLGDPDSGMIRVGFSDYDIVSETLDPWTMQQTTRNLDWALHSHRFYMQHHSYDDNYKAGDGFDPSGKARAPMYYNAFESENGTITFNYFVFFPWSGPSNYGVLTSYLGKEQYTRMIIPPWNEGPGNWKSIGVTVCNSASPGQPLAIHYRQHRGAQMYDCTKGECLFYETSDTHPVGFVSLSEHEIYGMSATELIHNEMQVEFWINLHGFLKIHRTAFRDSEGNSRFLDPLQSDIIQLAEQDDIPENVASGEYWQAFGGTWGPSSWDDGRYAIWQECQENVTQYADLFCRDEESSLLNNTCFGIVASGADIICGQDPSYPICLDNSTTIGTLPCPTESENRIFHLVLQLLGIESPDNLLIEAGTLLVEQLIDGDSFVPDVSPAAKVYYREIAVANEVNAPIWQRLSSDTTGEEYCRHLLEIPDLTRLPPSEERLPLEKSIVGIFAICVILAVLCVGYYVSAKCFEKSRPILMKDEKGQYLQPTFRDKMFVYHMTIAFSAAYAFCLVGIILFYIGFERLIAVRERWFNFVFGGDIDILRFCFFTIGTFMVIVDTALLVTFWISSADFWRRLNEAYFDLVGDTEGLRSFNTHYALCTFDRVKARTAVFVTFAISFLCLHSAVIMAVLGTISVGTSYFVTEQCRNSIGSLNGICFSFSVFGMEEIQCGQDFLDFCNSWAQEEMILTLWGSFIVCMSHFFFIALACSNWIQMKWAEHSLSLIETREAYLESLKRISNDGNSIGKAENGHSEEPNEESSQNEQQLAVDSSGVSEQITQDEPPS